MAFVPSKYQDAIRDFVVNGTGNGVVRAVAGSGKTFTLVWLARLGLFVGGLFVAFNKHIADELGAKLKGTGMVAKTLHSVGWNVLRNAFGENPNVQGNKYWKLVRDLVRGLDVKPEREQAIISGLVQLLELVRLNLVDPADQKTLAELMTHHNISDLNGYIQHVPALLAKGNSLAESWHLIDYTDMVYLPVVRGYDVGKWKSRWVLVDECQDLNKAQLAFALSLVKPGGRMLFVGDDRQAIYGFAGADAESFQNIIRQTNATVLPLSVCYRCPTSHIDLARSLVPEMEAAPDAKAGTLDHVSKAAFMPMTRGGDVVLCRLTAPLVTECIAFIRNRRPAVVKGRDIGKTLVAIIDKMNENPAFDYERLGDFLDAYHNEQRGVLQRRDATEGAYEALADRVEAVRTCWEEYTDCKTAADLSAAIVALFSDDDNAGRVIFSTVHRAKGLEAERVFIIRPGVMPMTWKDQRPWEYQQELNIEYVAYTRSTDALYFVEEW